MKSGDNITLRKKREERKKERALSIRKSRRLAMKEKRMRRSTIGDAWGISPSKNRTEYLEENLAEQTGAAAAVLYDQHSKLSGWKGDKGGKGKGKREAKARAHRPKAP